MQKTFTKIFATALAAFSFVAADAQTVLWPTTDTNTVKASQFNGAASMRRDSNQAAFWGWTTKGLTAANPQRVDSAIWEWSQQGWALGGAYSDNVNNPATNTQRITSPSLANGAALFNSDYLDTRGNPAGPGTGPAPTPHSGELISPRMNLTGQTGVILKFNQLYRRFMSKAWVTWSEDGGLTWKTPVQVNSDIATNASSARTSVISVPLVGSVGTANFRVKFIYDGTDTSNPNGSGYYFWILDDVQILSGGADVGVSFTACPPSIFTPKTQVEPFAFLADVENAGTLVANGVSLNVRVTDPSSAVVYNQSLSYGNMNAGTKVENRILPAWNVNPNTAAIGVYRIVYRVSTTSGDYNGANDSVVYNYVVSDTSAMAVLNPTTPTPPPARANEFLTTYTKELGSISLTRPAASFWAAGEAHSWRTGNIFQINNANRHSITHIVARVSNPAASTATAGIGGQTISARLYRWVDANNDTTIQASERTLLAGADTTFDAAFPAGSIWLSLRLRDINTDNWFYPTDTGRYLAMIEYTTSSTTKDCNIAFNNTINYNASVFLSDSLRRSRYVSVLGKGPDDAWNPVTFTPGYLLVPVVRLRMLPFRVNTNEVLPTEQQFEVYPNPATANLTLSVNFEKMADAVAVRILDMTGKEIRYQQFDNVQKDNYTFNVSDLANGTYMLQVVTAQGARAKKFVVQH